MNIVEILVSAPVTIMLFLCVFSYVNKKQIAEKIGLKNKLIAAFPSDKTQKIYFTIYTIICFGVILMFFLFYKRNFLFVIKRIAVMALLCPIVWIDKKEQIIPNAVLLVGLIMKVILLVADGIFDFEKFKQTFLPNLIATVIVFVLLMVFVLITRGGMGAGDIKLFTVMALLLGSPSIFSILFFTAFSSFFCAISLLIARKKGKKDNIAFAPMIFAGTLISMFVTGA